MPYDQGANLGQAVGQRFRAWHLLFLAGAVILGMAGPRDAGWPYGIGAMLLALAVLIDLDGRP